MPQRSERSPGDARTWSFDGDGALLRLAAESIPLRLMDGRDEFPALHTAHINPYPHQISAVYDELLPRRPLRFLLADDPGAGKTIMTGLYIKERLLRGDLQRCLIICPSGLIDQWQEELLQRFRLAFYNYAPQPAGRKKAEDPLARHRLVIARLDQIKGNEQAIAALAAIPWDLVVFDEAHKLSARRSGVDVAYTKRYHLAEQLGRASRDLLFLTATPHNGKPEEFQLFLALLDHDRFTDLPWTGQPTPTNNVMRRLLKEQLLTFDGKPLFPERWAHTLTYQLSPLEMDLYERVTAYVCGGMSRADQHYGSSQEQYRKAVSFALMLLQRRLASSPEAILNSLCRRRERLERLLSRRLKQLAAHDSIVSEITAAQLQSMQEAEREDETIIELSDTQEQLLAFLTPAQTNRELEEEIADVRELEALATTVRAAKTDSKWQQLRRVLADRPAMFDNAGKRLKLIIFTEHRDTLRYLVDRITAVLAASGSVVTIHGGMTQAMRYAAMHDFTSDERVQILVATDAAGEGINLQCAHLMINYDLPWNPNRLEQRFGRIHRIGQTEVCHVWHLVAPETREGKVFETLLRKLEIQRKALSGRVFDILGDLFPEQELRDLLLEAVRGHADEFSRQQFEQRVTNAVDEYRIQAALAVQSVGKAAMDSAEVADIHDRLENARAVRVQPDRVERWFLDAFALLGGSLRAAGRGRHELLRIPLSVRARLAADDPLKDGCFIRFDAPPADAHGNTDTTIAQVGPGHPLLHAVAESLMASHKAVLKQGAILVDEASENLKPRLLYLFDHRVDIVIPEIGEAGKASSRRLSSLELDLDWLPDGSVAHPNEQRETPEEPVDDSSRPSPYFTYRVPTSHELAQIRRQWAVSELNEHRNQLEQQAVRIAAERLAPAHTQAAAAAALKNISSKLANTFDDWPWEPEYISELEQQGSQLNLGYRRRQKVVTATRQAQEWRERNSTHRAQQLGLLERALHLPSQPATLIGVALIVPASAL